MRSTFLFAILLILADGKSARADSPGSNFEHKTASPDGSHLIVMKPEGIYGDAGMGKVYKSGQKWGSPLWTVPWFAQEVMLSNTGDELVRFGPWASDMDKHTDLAVAFYFKGKLLKQYQVRDLIKDPERLVCSVSHYTWSASKSTQPTGFSQDGRVFHLVLCDRTAYDFDTRSGVITKTSTDHKAKSMHDLWQEERDAEKLLGARIFEKSPLKALYEPHFEVQGISAGAGKSCFDFKESEWTCRMRPKKPMPMEVEIGVIYPRRKDNSLAMIMSPEPILSAVEAALAHPYVIRAAKADKKASLLMQVSAEHLYHERRDIEELITAFKFDAPDLKDSDVWAEFFLRTSDSGTFWLNLKNRWVVRQGSSNGSWPWPLYLMNERGDALKDTSDCKIKAVPDTRDPFGVAPKSSK
jgi:hypothetical protein